MTASDTIPDSPFDRTAPPPAPARPVRPFFWSVRRELWENQSVWIAPLAVAALVLLPALGARFAFVICALALEGTGLTLAVRSHMAEALEISR